MRYAEFQREYERFQSQRRAIDRMQERGWFLGDMIVNIHIQPQSQDAFPDQYGGDRTIAITVARCTYSQGSRTSFYDGRRADHLDDVTYEHAGGELRSLTADQIRRVAACRELAERWVAGLLDDLPQEAPDSIDRRPLPGRPS